MRQNPNMGEQKGHRPKVLSLWDISWNMVLRRKTEGKTRLTDLNESTKAVILTTVLLNQLDVLQHHLPEHLALLEPDGREVPGLCASTGWLLLVVEQRGASGTETQRFHKVWLTFCFKVTVSDLTSARLSTELIFYIWSVCVAGGCTCLSEASLHVFVCFCSSSRQLLLCGMHSGSIRVYPLQPGHLAPTTMQACWALSVHDNHYGHLRHICCSFDDLFVLTAGDDGNIFSFSRLPPEELQRNLQRRKAGIPSSTVRLKTVLGEVLGIFIPVQELLGLSDKDFCMFYVYKSS